MSEETLRGFFADVRLCLNINLGQFCDRNQIFRSDFSNFLKGKKYWTSLYKLQLMAIDIMNNIRSFEELYKEIA